MLSISLHFLVIAFIILLCVVSLLIVVVLLYGLYQYRKQGKIDLWQEIIDEEISHAIVNEDEASARPKLDALSGKPAFRMIFLEKLVSAESKFSGMAGGVIRSLFGRYGLEKEALNKLNQKRPFLIAGGIQELTSMQVEKALPAISGYLQHLSPQVYQEAQYSVVSFKGFEGLAFLDDAMGILSEWQQLRLLNSIPSVPADAGERISFWLQSGNSSVIIFTLRLITKYQLLSLYDEVLLLLNHHELSVRLQAVQSLQSLENSGTLTDLQSVYTSQPVDVQIEILKAIKKMGDLRAVIFFREKLYSNAPASVRIHAAEGLFELGMASELKELASRTDTETELIMIIKHALQEKA
ncbi:hypothetical protein FIC_01777 [Flavobacteriaceae bacterium 3519-10]|nr:hypothetical protein FIC_01777 [Flavobacteriaceae bacterium 3519-10]